MPNTFDFPSDFSALERKYKGKTTRPVDQSKMRVKVKPQQRKQPDIKVVPMPSVANTARSALSIAQNAPAALADLAVSVPKAAYNYARTSTPSKVVADVKRGASGLVDYVTENPAEAFVETVAGTPKAVGEMFREATLARDAGDVSRAEQIEKLAVPMLLAAAVPGGRAAKGAAKGAAKAEKSLVAKAEKTLATKPTGGKPAATTLAKPEEKPLAAKRTKKAAASGAEKPAVNFSEGFGTFKAGPTKVIWEDNKDGTIEVVSLRTPSSKRGQGAGRAAMQDFLAEADRQGLDVKLGASPLDKRTKLNKLVDFYKSLGFETTGKNINMAGEPEMIRRAQSVAPTGEKPLAAKPTKKAAAPAAAPNPTKVIAEEYSPEIARRVRDVVDADAGLEQWREAAANLQGTQSNRPYQPENDPAFRDFDLSVYGMRKTIDQPRLFDLDVERQRWSPEQERNMLGFQAIVGRPIMTGMADRTPSGTTITRIGPTELDIPIKEHGGQDYMRDYPHSWGVSTKGMASNFMNTARRLKREFGVNPIWMPWRMQGPGSDFSKTTGETIMSHANSALGLDTRNAMDRFIKENYIPDFAGIGDPRGYLQFGELAGPQRKAMEADLASRFEQEGALSLPLTRVLITDPNQLSSKAFHLQNIAEIDPDAEVVVKSLNPTYHYNTPGAYEGTLEPEVQENLNVAEVVAPLLRAKYSDLGDLSVFRGQNAPLSPENFADQMARYEDLKAAFDARVAAGDTKAKPPRKPVPIGGTNKFMQSVFATGFLDDRAAQEIYDRMVASGARIK